MKEKVAESSLEAAIETALLAGGPDASAAPAVAETPVIGQLEETLATDPALAARVRVNTPENARLTVDHVVTDRLQEMVDRLRVRQVLCRLALRTFPKEPQRLSPPINAELRPISMQRQGIGRSSRWTRPNPA